MRKRAFYLLTLLLFIAAILTDLAAKRFAAGAATTMARGWHDGGRSSNGTR